MHASFISEDGLPTIIPLIGQMGSFDRPSAGIGEPMDVYLHGYVSSRIMNLARDGEKDAGMKICVCATKVRHLPLAQTSIATRRTAYGAFGTINRLILLV